MTKSEQTDFEYDVFLSHASADNPAVRELAQRLKGDGLWVWPRRMTASGGAGSARSIPLAVEHGLESSRTLVLVMSQAAFDSEWVTLERYTVLFRDPTNQQRRFIPLRLDKCGITDAPRHGYSGKSQQIQLTIHQIGLDAKCN